MDHRTAAEPASANAMAQEPESGKAEKGAEQKKDREVDIKGRVYVRDTITRQGWSNALRLTSARLGVKYRDRTHGLQAELEAELAEKNAEVRDAYLRIKAGGGIRVQAGRFKRPISAIALTSRWDLPVIERGAINDFQLYNENTGEPDELPLGRATGVQVQIRNKNLPAEPEITLGVFRSAVHEQIADAVGANRQPLDWSEQFPEDIFGRVEAEPLPWMRVGASLAWVGRLDVAGEYDSFRHGVLSGIDLVIDRAPLRVWVEGLLGHSSFHLGSTLEAQGYFTAARAIVAARVPLARVYVEPYIAAQHFDLGSERDEDGIFQGGGGINLGLDEIWKLQVAADYMSLGNLLYGDATQFHVQLGAVF